ncbi:hypothetical protein HDU97_008349 [Phlyctochytrium planicorne]|nr:hypothetical protein HDU97_008349 [Phlyctochytrium planicorne]
MALEETRALLSSPNPSQGSNNNNNLHETLTPHPKHANAPFSSNAASSIPSPSPLSSPSHSHSQSPAPTPSSKGITLDWVMVRRTFRLLGLLFEGGHRNPDSLLPTYLALISASLVLELLAYRIGVTTSAFYTYLVGKDWEGFKRNTLECTALYIAVSLVKGLIHFIHGLMAIRLRRRLTLVLQKEYTASRKILFEMAVLRLPNPNSTLSEGTIGTSTSNNETLSPKPNHQHEHLNVPASPNTANRAHAPAKIEQLPPHLADNPDQTIAQDIDKLGDQTRELLENLVVDPLVIMFYTYQVYMVSRSLLSPFLVYLYFAISVYFTGATMRPLIPLIYQRERAEGDFRFVHVHLRQHAESVAVLGGQKEERKRLDMYLSKVLVWQRRVLERSALLKCLTECINYLGSCVSYIITAVPIFDGTLDGKPAEEIASVVAKNLFTTLYLIFRFTLITNFAEKFSAVAGFTARIGLLQESIDTVKASVPPSPPSSSPRFTPIPIPAGSSLQKSQPLLRVSSLTYNLPAPHSSTPLTKPLNFHLVPGRHLMITGESGVGKSVLVKVLAGIWPEGCVRGGIEWGIGMGDVMIMTQVPYIAPEIVIGDKSGMTGADAASVLRRCRKVTSRAGGEEDGSVEVADIDEEERWEDVEPSRFLLTRYGPFYSNPSNFPSHLLPVLDQVSYPFAPASLSIPLETVRHVLSVVNLSHVLDADRVSFRSWSQGERQRLAFARVLLRRPRVVVMDEATSAVDAAVEESMWRELLKDGTTTCCVVSHREIEGFRPDERVLVEGFDSDVIG